MTNHKLRTRWDSLSAEELRDCQAHALRRYLTNHVVPFSGYYSELFRKEGTDPASIRSLEDLERLPFSSKSSLISTRDGTPRTRDFVLVPDEKVLSRRPSTIARALYRGRAGVKRDFEREYRPILMTSTTGRSAEPVPFLYTQHDLDHLETTGRRLMEICDSRPDFRHFNLFPFAPHLAFWQAHYAGLGYNTFTLSTGGGKVMGTEGNVRLLGKIKPDALIGMPTFLYHVLQVAVEEGLECPNLQRIVLGGEKVPDGLRRKLKTLCAELGSGSVDIMATYGLTEAKMAWPECPARDQDEPTGYHLYPDLGIVEVIDPDTGKVVGEGEPGEIVFTPLDSRGSVVLRYRTGDLISEGLTYEPCPACGRKVPRLLGRISRVSDMRRLHIGKVKGTLVNFNDLEHVLDDLDGVGTWQIELRKRNDDPLDCDEILVHVAPTGRLPKERLTKAISDRFSAATEIRPNRIEFHDAEDLRERHGVGTALKEEKVIDRRELNPTPKNSETTVSHHELS
jgi:phenylacetate-coenzyme A ligase PaaK-like adenylate-forming protein